MVQLKTLAIVLISFLVFSCSSDDDNPTGLIGIYSNQFTGDKGSYFEIEVNGEKTTYSGNNIFGWDTGMLLGSNYWRQIRLPAEGHTLAFRLSFPEEKSFVDEVQNDWTLRFSKLRLENTTNLSEIYAELWFQYSTDDKYPDDNMQGRVTILKDHSVGGTSYDYVGEIDAELNGMEVKGVFWLND